MSQLSTFLTALWVSTAAAQLSTFTNVLSTASKATTNELQAVVDPVGKGAGFVVAKTCTPVKKGFQVTYEDYDSEPDMSQLTLVFKTRAKTVTYNLTLAPQEIPLERWYNTSLPFLLFLHGFTDDPSKSSFTTISDAFLEQGDVNILALDASSLIHWLYLRSSTMVHFIGQKLASVLAALVDAGVDPLKIHLIGHSLGSHIAGFTGKTFRETTGALIGRISGLDPAGPCFADVNVTLRLAKGDAVFVDVIHTDAGVYGLDFDIGHVDFYPNSGSEQPNCLFQTCSHSRAWEYYADSILQPESYIGVECDSWESFRKGNCNLTDTSIMGYNCPLDARGDYYLQTSGEKPFGRGLEGLKYIIQGLVRKVKNDVGDLILG